MRDLPPMQKEGMILAPASPIHDRLVPRSPLAEVCALVDSLVARIPEFANVDRRLLEEIFPTEDYVARMQFVPGEGLINGYLGRLINARLHLPKDGQPWRVGYRCDIYREPDERGKLADYLRWEVVNEVGARAERLEQVHLYSTIDLPDGRSKLGVSRRRLANEDPRELPGKGKDRYSMTVTPIMDYRAEPQFQRFLRRSQALREVVAEASPNEMQIVRTDMDRPFKLPLLWQVGARSHNYYVLNLKTGARIFLHYFDFWHGQGKRLIDRLGQLLMPHEVGHYEVTSYVPAERLTEFDASLNDGLRSTFRPALPP